ncbi:MAG: HAD hydrolase-like protein [Clostridiales bacterium]|nr:HAD hydrolase-like protein [Clostridiales bacterium]
MLQAVLIDFDGTLMNTDEVVLRSWEHTYRELGREVPPAEEIRRTFGEPLRRSMEYIFPDVPVEESLSIYRAYNKARFLTYTEPYPGMVELIDRLREEGILTALVTSRLRNTTYLGLEHFDLVRRFDAILTEDDIEASKPDPDPVYTTLRKLGVPFEPSPSWAAEGRIPQQKEHVLMIGDSVYDIRCCENAGIGSVLVGWTNTLQIACAASAGLMKASADSPLTAAASSGESVHPDYILYEADAFDDIFNDKRGEQ